MLVVLQEKLIDTQDSSLTQASSEASSELTLMQQGLQESNAALEAAQGHLAAKQEAEIASLKVWLLQAYSFSHT